MILHFLRLQDGKLTDDIDLRKYGLELGQMVTNLIVQELCVIQPNITRLNLTNCKEVSDVGLWALAKHCSHLQGSFINQSKFSFIYQLLELILSGCDMITHVGLRSISLTCTTIRKLNFNDCHLLDDMVLTVIAAGGWKLQELYLRNCIGMFICTSSFFAFNG